MTSLSKSILYISDDHMTSLLARSTISCFISEWWKVGKFAYCISVSFMNWAPLSVIISFGVPGPESTWELPQGWRRWCCSDVNRVEHLDVSAKGINLRSRSSRQNDVINYQSSSWYESTAGMSSIPLMCSNSLKNELNGKFPIQQFSGTVLVHE